jgi:hypothetical protein
MMISWSNVKADVHMFIESYFNNYSCKFQSKRTICYLDQIQEKMCNLLAPFGYWGYAEIT